MKIYRIVKNTPYKNRAEEKYFTSREKALGYIMGLVSKDTHMGAYSKNEEWYNATWCYDYEKLFNVKNWNKYCYVTDSGSTVLYIEQIDVL